MFRTDWETSEMYFEIVNRAMPYAKGSLGNWIQLGCYMCNKFYTELRHDSIFRVPIQHTWVIFTQNSRPTVITSKVKIVENGNSNLVSNITLAQLHIRLSDLWIKIGTFSRTYSSILWVDPQMLLFKNSPNIRYEFFNIKVCHPLFFLSVGVKLIAI